jgi:hypothetical protein
MANKILWAAEAVATLMTTGELNNKADLTLHMDGADYDNATNKYTEASFLFFGTFDAACDAGAVIELHLFYKLDGTKYGDGEDGDAATPAKSGNSLHGIFHIGVQADAYQQIVGVPLLPFAFRAGLYLNTGQDLTPVDTHFLKICPYNSELQ